MTGSDEPSDVPQPTTERQAKASDVEIKNGKVIFRQKPMSFEKMTETMQEMVNFREWLESRTQRNEPPLTEIPQSYWPLIAKFTQESDKTITGLSKYIQQELAPDDGDDINCSVSILPLSVIEDVAKLLATRVNYGIESALAKTPAALCAWRWELKQEYLAFLPRVSREKVEARLADRIQPQPLLSASSNEALSVVVDASHDNLSEGAASAGGDENQMVVRKAGRSKGAINPERATERAAKEKERLEKRAAKAEKEKKDKEAQEKARPFVLKRDAELAPMNWFRDARQRRRADADMIVIDEDDTEIHDIEMSEPEPSPNASPRNTVRSIMAWLSEAEVTGDTVAVRVLLSELHDRTRIPAKVLIFHEDERPGYFGTFTKRSRLIKPRRPFARDDIAIDYAHDSDAEWGEEEEGGGDDVLGDSDDERDDDDESDDLDGWLIDGDDEEVVTPVEEREGMDAFPFPPIPEGSKSKRKVGKEETDAEGKAKKRKVVVPLVPFIKGPCWESEIGNCEYEPLNQYRIQLFNDTPYPLDPFTFVSVPVDARSAAAPSAASTSGTKLQPQFVMPALPPHLLNSNPPASESASSNSANGQQPQAKRTRGAPKIPFPDAHIPFLKEKVASMCTSSLIALVEALHLDLKTHKVKKNAIEAKIREICVKDQRHVWSVKADTEVGMLFAVTDYS
ncbi:chromatin assembly factor 1 subunit A-domain-containing protein [Lactifluus subvellereus]|nr:chromatin assembly factor 1 subunit A-domain-containing protein [Lactifluus subvellereus]